MELPLDQLAKTAVRTLGLKTGTRVAVHLGNGELLSRVASLLDAVGASTERSEHGAEAAIVDVARPTQAAVPEELVVALPEIGWGARLTIVVHDGRGVADTDTLAQSWQPWLGLARLRVERSGDALILAGARHDALSGPQRRSLRAVGHHLDPSVLVGRPGLTAKVLDAVRSALDRHGIVKVKLTPQCVLDKRDAARELALRTGSILVQRVGKTALLHRPDVALEPPMKRTGRR